MNGFLLLSHVGRAIGDLASIALAACIAGLAQSILARLRPQKLITLDLKSDFIARRAA
jgi:hypothetical protein